jgi:predicted ester cyclase
MSKERAEEVMRRYLTEVLSERKFELIPEFVADDMVDHTQTMRGPAALDAHARGFCENIPDLEIEVVRIFATDDTAVGIWRWRGTPIQPMGISATGNPIYPRLIASIFEFKDGMLVDYRPFADAVDVATQISAPAAS